MLMAYAGLRLGEACARDASWLKGNKLIVKQSMESDVRSYVPQNCGEVRLPDWLVEENNATFTYPIPKHLYKWVKRRNLSPHQLRHYFATQLFSKSNNLEAIRRQMRHSNIKTTLSYYLEVSATWKIPCSQSVPFHACEVSQTSPECTLRHFHLGWVLEQGCKSNYNDCVTKCYRRFEMCGFKGFVNARFITNVMMCYNLP